MSPPPSLQAADEAFLVALARLQPSQLYLSAAKLRRQAARADPAHLHRAHPVPVRRMGEDLVLTDGHTRAFSAWQGGEAEVLAVWEEDELDWEAYAVCVEWCKAEGVLTIPDLAGRIVSARDYERLWIGRCRALHAALEAARTDGGPGAGPTRSR